MIGIRKPLACPRLTSFRDPLNSNQASPVAFCAGANFELLLFLVEGAPLAKTRFNQANVPGGFLCQRFRAANLDNGGSQ